MHCPICGQAMMSNGSITPCQHLAFIYVGEAGEFEYQSEDFGKRLATVDIEDLSFDNFHSLLKKAGYGNSLLGIEITQGGMACGPVWYTDVFNFNYKSLSSSNKVEQRL
jgi:hypothetical protein